MYCPLHSPWPFFSIRPAHASYSTNALEHAVDLLHFSSMAIFGSTGSSSSSTSAGTMVRWSDIAKSWIAKSWAALRVMSAAESEASRSSEVAPSLLPLLQVCLLLGPTK